jgi:hypothetical protein
MTTFAQPTSDATLLLRRALQIDAAVSGSSVLLILFAAAPLATATGISVSLIQIFGLVFLLFTAGLVFTVSRPVLDRRLAWIFVGLNFAWVALSFAALLFGWLPLTSFGFWFVVVQAVVVDLLGVAQYLGLRRSRVGV